MSTVLEPISIPETYPNRVYIEALQHRGVTLEQIAEALNLSVRMVNYIKKNDLEPRWSVKQTLIELYAIHCSTASDSQGRI